MITIPKIWNQSLLLFVAILGVVIIAGNSANAGTIASQIEDNANTSSITFGSVYVGQYLGNGLSGTIESVIFKGGTANSHIALYACTSAPANDWTFCDGGGAVGDFSTITCDGTYCTGTLLSGSGVLNSAYWYTIVFFKLTGEGSTTLRGTTSNIYTNGQCYANKSNTSCGNSINDLWFRLSNGIDTETNYIKIISPEDEAQTGYFDNFEIQYKYDNEYYNLYNNREIKIYVSNDNGSTYPYTSSKTFISSDQLKNILIPVPEDLGFDDYKVYAELWINESKLYTSEIIDFTTISLLLGDVHNPFEVFSPPSSSYILGRLTVESASNSKQTCGEVYQDSSYLNIGAGIAYGSCLAGSFLFEPSQYSVNLVKGQLYRVSQAFPFDYIITGFTMVTSVLTDDFIASSSNSSISLDFDIDFRGLDTSEASSHSFGIGHFTLFSAGMFDNVGNTGNSVMPIISLMRQIIVALMWISFIGGVVYMASNYFYPNSSK